jgi:hypothetical protein
VLVDLEEHIDLYQAPFFILKECKCSKKTVLFTGIPRTKEDSRCIYECGTVRDMDELIYLY